MFKLYTDVEVTELLVSMGYEESTHEQYQEDYTEKQDSGFVSIQTACVEHNLKNFLPSSLKQNRLKEESKKKFYIVKLSNKVSDVRVWGWNE